jgi:hypothetical protein
VQGLLTAVAAGSCEGARIRLSEQPHQRRREFEAAVDRILASGTIVPARATRSGHFAIGSGCPIIGRRRSSGFSSTSAGPQLPALRRDAGIGAPRARFRSPGTGGTFRFLALDDRTPRSGDHSRPDAARSACVIAARRDLTAWRTRHLRYNPRATPLDRRLDRNQLFREEQPCAQRPSNGVPSIR